jgi:predicted nucleotidyltransferase
MIRWLRGWTQLRFDPILDLPPPVGVVGCRQNAARNEVPEMKLQAKRFWMMINAMSVAELPIQLDREKIAEFCRARGIRKLSLFGSILRDDFDPARSDVDVLAEFVPGVRPGLKFFGYGEDLAEIIGRKVDFNTEAWLSEYFRDEVVREAVPIYEQA